MQQENEITSGNAEYQCYNRTISFADFFNNYAKYSKYIAREIQYCKNAEPLIFCCSFYYYINL